MEEKEINQEKESENRNNSQENLNAEGIIPEEILDVIPEEDRGRVATIIKQTMFSSVMRRGNPIADKITTEHISQLISKSDDADKRDRKRKKRRTELQPHINSYWAYVYWISYCISPK